MMSDEKKETSPTTCLGEPQPEEAKKRPASDDRQEDDPATKKAREHLASIFRGAYENPNPIVHVEGHSNSNNKNSDDKKQPEQRKQQAEERKEEVIKPNPEWVKQREELLKRQKQIDAIQSVIHDIDLCGLYWNTPEELTNILSEIYKERFSIRTPPTDYKHLRWSIQTDQFPNNTMMALLDFCDAYKISIVSFSHKHGKVKCRVLSNADLRRLLLSNQRSSLKCLRIRPKPKTAPPIRLNKTGYYAMERLRHVQELEISIAGDYDGQLLKQTCLGVDQLEQLVLWNVSAFTTRKKLASLVQRAKRLKQLTLHKPELVKEDDDDDESDALGPWLTKLAKEAGNPNLQVVIK